LRRADFDDGMRALKSHTLNKHSSSGKIPSLFAFLASASRMKRAVFVCRNMQASRAKFKMKNIPGASVDENGRKSNRAVDESGQGAKRIARRATGGGRGHECHSIEDRLQTDKSFAPPPASLVLAPDETRKLSFIGLS
jgi:hypothetical protein